jgi:hypothetical protein
MITGGIESTAKVDTEEIVADRKNRIIYRIRVKLK